MAGVLLTQPHSMNESGILIEIEIAFCLSVLGGTVQTLYADASHFHPVSRELMSGGWLGWEEIT